MLFSHKAARPGGQKRESRPKHQKHCHGAQIRRDGKHQPGQQEREREHKGTHKASAAKYRPGKCPRHRNHAGSHKHGAASLPLQIRHFLNQKGGKLKRRVLRIGLCDTVDGAEKALHNFALKPPQKETERSREQKQQNIGKTPAVPGRQKQAETGRNRQKQRQMRRKGKAADKGPCRTGQAEKQQQTANQQTSPAMPAPLPDLRRLHKEGGIGFLFFLPFHRL